MPLFRALEPCVVGGALRKRGEVFEAALAVIPPHLEPADGPPPEGAGEDRKSVV